VTVAQQFGGAGVQQPQVRLDGQGAVSQDGTGLFERGG
jgi:hypothetical protein